MQERVYKTAVRDTADLKWPSLRLGRAFRRQSSTKQLPSGGYDYQPVSKQRDMTSSTCCNQPVLFRATKRYHTTTGSCQSHPHFIEENSYALRMLKYLKHSVNTLNNQYINTLTIQLHAYRNWNRCTQNAICLHFLPYLLDICRKFECLISQGSVATCLR